MKAMLVLHVQAMIQYRAQGGDLAWEQSLQGMPALKQQQHQQQPKEKSSLSQSAVNQAVPHIRYSAGEEESHGDPRGEEEQEGEEQQKEQEEEYV